METDVFVLLTGGITEAIKRAGISSKWGAIISIVVSVVLLTLYQKYTGAAINGDTLIKGLKTALITSGIYSGVKAMVK